MALFRSPRLPTRQTGRAAKCRYFSIVAAKKKCQQNAPPPKTDFLRLGHDRPSRPKSAGSAGPVTILVPPGTTVTTRTRSGTALAGCSRFDVWTSRIPRLLEFDRAIPDNSAGQRGVSDRRLQRQSRLLSGSQIPRSRECCSPSLRLPKPCV
jgi:hypothetical protein